jgi:cell wall-associated NlpC family hydrolase
MRTAVTLTAAAFVGLVLLAGSFGMVAVQPAASTGNAPSDEAVRDIPAAYLALYQAAGDRYELDWSILAAIGKVETNHCRSNAPGVHSGSNFAGAQGCMQFMPGTWAMFGQGGSPYDPADAIPAAARYLVASGAPGDIHAAVLAYNHSEAYVAQVLAQAAVYRGLIHALPAAVRGTIRARILKIAKSTLTVHTGYLRYSQAGALTDNPTPSPPARTDCSQWVRAIYLAAGVPDPGTTTFDMMTRGHQVVHPLPGDLLLTADGAHVEIVVGDGRTIGHGTPPIDYANVSDFPGAFFMRFAGVE